MMEETQLLVGGVPSALLRLPHCLPRIRVTQRRLRIIGEVGLWKMSLSIEILKMPTQGEE